MPWNAGSRSSTPKPPLRDRADLGAAREWPRPLPVVLFPARDEALSSWLARHAAFYGLGITSMRRHCLPDAVSLSGLDRELTPDQEARLAHLFRRDPVAIRGMMHMDRGLASTRLVSRAVDHRCKPCAQSLVADGHVGAIPRFWFHTWRITCERCGSPIVSASKAPWTALPDLFPHLWSAALKGERLLKDGLNRAGPAASALPATMLRALMISTDCNPIPEHGGRTLDAIVPGFNATLDRHELVIPFTSLIDVPLPVRTALLAGLAFALDDADAAIPAIWNATSGMHRSHLGFVLTELGAGPRPRDHTIAEVGRVLAARFAVYGRTAMSHSDSGQ